MGEPSSVSAGEVGGIVAGAIAIATAVGAGIKWVAGWVERRASSRAQKLQAWHDELQAREEKHDSKVAAWEEKIEARVRELEGQLRTVRLAFELVAAPLRALDPKNDALDKAEQLLAAAFPLDPLIPGDMGATLGVIDRNNAATGNESR